MKISKAVFIVLLLMFIAIGCGSSSGGKEESTVTPTAGLSGTWRGDYYYQQCSQALCSNYTSDVIFTINESGGVFNGTFTTVKGTTGTVSGTITGGSLSFTVKETFPCVATLNGLGTVSGDEMTYNLSGKVCDDSINGAGTVYRGLTMSAFIPITLDVPLPPLSSQTTDGRQLSLCRFTITGPGMSDIVRDVDITGKTSISETFNVPSGVNRKIMIQMYVENDNYVIYQASREGINLTDAPVTLDLNLEATEEYFQPPEFEGVMSISNAESRSVKLSWKPAADNITPHDRIQYLIYLSTESIIGREGEFINTYSLGKGSVLEEDALMSYEYNGDELLLISYEYEGALPSQGEAITGQQATGRLKPGTPYYFIVKAMDEWGHVEGNLAESEEVVVYMLDVSVEGSGTVTSDPTGIKCGEKCSEDFLRGTEVTLTAAAAEGESFEGWTGNGQCVGTGDCILTLNNNESITATFSALNSCGGGDTIDCSYLDDECNRGECDENTGNCVKVPDYEGEACDESNGQSGTPPCQGCECENGETRLCGSNVGICSFGTETCIGGAWSECSGEVGPTTEVCDGEDNNCDGNTDEGCDCINGATRSCGSNTGACTEGIETCVNGAWNDCSGEVGPTTEICGDSIDQDCNGSDLTCSTSLIPINTVTTSSVWEVSGFGDIVKLMDGTIWDATLYSYNSMLWLIADPIVVCNNKLFNVNRGNSVWATLITGSPTTCSASEIYSISDIYDNIYSNDIIRLSNGSMWEVHSIDSYKMILWFSFQRVVITSNSKMVNIDSGESVGVTQIK